MKEHEDENKNKAIQQWVQSVSSFSSQYGGERSISYTAANIVGKTTVFPAYGDFTSTFVMRQYGNWWNKYDETMAKFNNYDFLSEDYIELVYEKQVVPSMIEIYETFNGGSVVRVLGTDSTCIETRKWQVLHVAEDFLSRSFGDLETAAVVERIGPLPSSRPICVLRLEFNQTKLRYHTEIDGVSLTGYPVTLTLRPSHLAANQHRLCGPQQEVVSGVDRGEKLVNLSDSTETSNSCITSEFIADDKVKVNNKQLLHGHPSLTDCLSSNQISSFHSGDRLIRIVDDLRLFRIRNREISLSNDETKTFDKLSSEILQSIISHLDLKSVCRLACVSKLFYKQCYDPMQYRTLNLKIFWHTINDTGLMHLITRCKFVQHLNLSWCEHLTKDSLNCFLSKCGQNLLTLDISNCSFADCDTMTCIVLKCPKIADLNLSNNMDIGSFTKLGLCSTLRRLNLYRTNINTIEIHTILGSNENLQFLNIGSCVNISICDSVCSALAKHCLKLEELNLWRCSSLSCFGIQTLVDSCLFIKRLDLGWCSNLQDVHGDNLLDCLRKCTHLEKLILTAIRTVNDDTIICISKNCSNLRHLDIVGNTQLTDSSINELLEKCPNMELLDLSFCNLISNTHKINWQLKYPKLNIIL